MSLSNTSHNDLAPVEQEKLNEFQIITDFAEEDYDKVVKLLQNNYWNLEIAISKYFDGQLDAEAERNTDSVHEIPTPPPTRPNQDATYQNVANPLIADNNWQIYEQDQLINNTSTFFKQLPIVRPISNKWRSHPGLQANNEKNQQQQSLFVNHFGSIFENPLIFLILLIPRTITFVLNSLTALFTYIFPSSPNSLPDEPTLLTFAPTNYFDSLTQDKTSLELFEGEFNDAFNIAKLENKYILLILIGNNEPSNVFLKKILNNPQVSEFLLSKSNELIIYLGNVNEPQSFEIAKTLKIRSPFPSISLIANVSNGPSGVSSMSILAKVPTRSPSAFITRLTKVIDIFNPELLSKKLEQEELEYSRKLRELQDRAYEESLNSDKHKQEAKRIEQELEETKLKHETFVKENKFKFYASLFKKFEDKQDESDEPKARIRFKMPNGKLITEKFSKSSKIFDIYSYIDLKLHLGTLSDDEIGELSSHTDHKIHGDYKHEFKFELISPFPRVSIDRNEGSKEIGDVKELWPNGNLLIEFDDLEDD